MELRNRSPAQLRLTSRHRTGITPRRLATGAEASALPEKSGLIICQSGRCAEQTCMLQLVAEGGAMIYAAHEWMGLRAKEISRPRSPEAARLNPQRPSARRPINASTKPSSLLTTAAGSHIEFPNFPGLPGRRCTAPQTSLQLSGCHQFGFRGDDLKYLRYAAGFNWLDFQRLYRFRTHRQPQCSTSPSKP